MVHIVHMQFYSIICLKMGLSNCLPSVGNRKAVPVEHWITVILQGTIYNMRAFSKQVASGLTSHIIVKLACLIQKNPNLKQFY